MPPTTAALTVNAQPRVIASAYAALVVVANVGAIPVRAISNPGDPDHNRSIAPGTTVEFHMAGRSGNLSLVADAATTVEMTLFDVRDLRESAAAFYKVPVEFITGRTKADVAASVARLTARERA